MTSLRTFWLGLLTLGVALSLLPARASGSRGPSTPDERLKAVELVELL